MVAFTACILEFPVAYVPTTNDSGGFLGGVPLDVYECALEPDTSSEINLPDKHVMLKFSCPQSVASARPELQPEVVERLLRARFTPRLRDATFPGRLVVRHSTETLDRVAL